MFKTLNICKDCGLCCLGFIDLAFDYSKAQPFRLRKSTTAHKDKRFSDGKCVYLKDDCTCNIESFKPKVCKDFYCEKYNGLVDNSLIINLFD